MALVRAIETWIAARDARLEAAKATTHDMGATSAGRLARAARAEQKAFAALHGALSDKARARYGACDLFVRGRFLDPDDLAGDVLLKFFANLDQQGGWSRPSGPIDVAARETTAYLVNALEFGRIDASRKAGRQPPLEPERPPRRNDADANGPAPRDLDAIADERAIPVTEALAHRQVPIQIEAAHEAIATDPESKLEDAADRRWLWEQRKLRDLEYDEILVRANGQGRRSITEASRHDLNQWVSRYDKLLLTKAMRFLRERGAPGLGEAPSRMPPRRRFVIPVSASSLGDKVLADVLSSPRLPPHDATTDPDFLPVVPATPSISVEPALASERRPRRTRVGARRQDSEEYVLGSADVPGCGTTLRVIADEGGPFVRAYTPGWTPIDFAVGQAPSQANGYAPQVPLLFEGSKAALDDLPQFRPGGPLRLRIASGGGRVDRRVSGRSFVVPVGESALRRLFELTTATQSRNTPGQWLHMLAARNGVRDGAALTAIVERPDVLATPWLRTAATGREVIEECGATTLDELLSRSDALSTDTLGAEVSTLLSLRGDLAPVENDTVLLVPTRTATSLLAAALIREVLLNRLPGLRIRVRPFDGMRERTGALTVRAEFDVEPVASAIDVLDEMVVEQLVNEGSDPVVLVSGGTKWEAGAVLEVAFRRRLACAYRVDEGAVGNPPWTFRFDQQPPLPPRVLRDRGDRPLVVATVGTSLLNAWRGWLATSRGVSFESVKGELPTKADRLADGVLARGGGMAGIWRYSAELTGLEAWRRARGVDWSDMAVLLVATDSAQPSNPGRLCGDALKCVLERAGAHVTVQNVLRLEGTAFENEATASEVLSRRVLTPVREALDRAEQAGFAPEILASGGQKLTSGLLLILGLGRRHPVYIAPRPDDDDEKPSLWRVRSRFDRSC